MSLETNTPNVVISDAPPPVYQCRNAMEMAVCDAVVQLLRRGYDPIAFIGRNEKGQIEVHARSSSFTSIGHAVDTFREAQAKLVDELFRIRKPVRDRQ